jgi:ribosomal protein S18
MTESMITCTSRKNQRNVIHVIAACAMIGLLIKLIGGAA